METRRALLWSASGHGALALWAIVAALVSAPFEERSAVTEVSLISGAEFAALVEQAGGGAPSPGREAPPPAAPEPEPTPESPEPAPPAPEAGSPATDLAPEPGDTATDAPRVAPRPSERPEPEAEVAPVPQQAAEPVPAPEATETPEPVAPAAPEAATTRIVTEATEEGGAERIALAPNVAPRPRARPARPPEPAPETAAQRQPEPEPRTEPTPEDPLSSAIDGALEAGGGAQAAEPGPPLTVGERDALRVAVQECWVVDVGSEAASVVVTVAMSMTRQGTVVGNEVRLVSAEGGSEAARSAAFQAARRAVLRCQGDGFDLPPDKYDRWRDIEIVFNPAEMRLR